MPNPIPKTNLSVRLIGKDGNAFIIIGSVCRVLREGGFPELAEAYKEEVVKGDYDHVLRTTMEYVEIV